MSEQPHILVVDDHRDIREPLKTYLEKNGYRVSDAANAAEARRVLQTGAPDLIVLDLNLPGMDGLDVCRRLRRESDVPIIMLTARVEETDRLIGLELGADDYICKPFSPREVVARVKAIFRRLHAEPSAPTLVSGSISLDDKTHQVMIDQQVLNLTPNEFGLLKIMMTQPDRVFSRSELVNRVQGYDFEGYDRTIDTHIKNLRKKIAERLPDQKIIRTVYGVGYKFSAPAD